MNFTFQFKLLLAIVSFIAVLLFLLQTMVLDKIPEQVSVEYAAQLKTFAFLKENFARFGNSTTRDYAKEIAGMTDSLNDKKLFRALRRIYKSDLKRGDENILYFYDSTMSPLRMLSATVNFNEQTRARELAGYSEVFNLDSSRNLIQEVDPEFVKYLLAMKNGPAVFSYYWSSKSEDLHYGKKILPIMIELSVKYQNKSEMINLFNRSYLSNFWHLKDTTYNLVFRSGLETEPDNEFLSSIHKDQVYLYKSSKTGKVFLIRWEGAFFLTQKEAASILFSLRWISPRSSSVMEDRSRHLRVFVGQDDVTGLTHIHIDTYAPQTNLYMLHYGIGLGFIFAIAFFVYVMFWQILSHANYFAKLSEEFTVSVEQSKTEEKLMDYYHSVLDFYYSILSKFIPKYRQKNIKEVFQFNLNEFSKIVSDMIHLRDHLEVQVVERTKELQKTVHDLKETQAQLVQSEKMALLGQLTAGIAHEIKNPLNFVNNFSELSAELLLELKDKCENKTISAEDVKAMNTIISDLVPMMQKVAEHGKRADSIVKGMLLHARAGAGERLPTDINALADEYLKLSYHGFRARDKSFNITMQTEYDSTIPPLNVVPQDMSRVFMNLITNGCYSAYEKKKELGDSFSPEIKITTRNLNDRIEIRIRDNGKGVAPGVMKKIFNPFFTTKPVGEGTGLGLSLSYDIIVNGHGGELKFETKENEFAEFIILLPKK